LHLARSIATGTRIRAHYIATSYRRIEKPYSALFVPIALDPRRLIATIILPPIRRCGTVLSLPDASTLPRRHGLG
jgi:hypothetical protein